MKCNTMKSGAERWVGVVRAAALLAVLGAPAAADSRPANGLFGYLPGDAMALICLDLEAIHPSPHFARAVQFLETFGESGPLHLDPESGLTPAGHVELIVAAVLPTGAALYAVQGARLNEAKVRAFFANRPANAPSFAVGDRSAIAAHDGNLVLFVAPTIALVGPREAVEAGAKTLSKQAASVDTSEVWRKRLHSVETAHPLWFAGESPREAGVALARRTLAAVDEVRGHATLAEAATVHVELTCGDAAACAALQERMRHGVDSVRNRAAVRLIGVGAVLDRITLTSKPGQVDVDAALERRHVHLLLGLGAKLSRLLQQ
jgi:hypothetical protein